MSAAQRLVARWRLRMAERAVDRSWTRRASLNIDKRVLALEGPRKR